MDEKRGYYKITDMVIYNKQNGRHSVLKIDKIVLNNRVKEEYFTSRYLERQ